MYFVYILECSDGTLYTGIATNVERRVREHNESEKGARYTKARRPVRIVYSVRYSNRSEASKEESRIKSLPRAEKLKMI